MSEEERDFEAEASEQGWVDKDGWKGDPDKHTDAKTFVERGEKIAGILKSRLDRQEEQIEGLQKSNREFGEYHKKTLEDQRNKSAARVAELEGELAQAITDGDGAAYTKTQREIDAIKSGPAPTNDAQAWDQMAQTWAGENKWYNENPKLADHANGISDRLRNEGYNGRAYFSELTRRVKEAFPEDFKNPNKDKPNGVEPPGQLSTGNAKKASYANLPADAKAACDDFVSQGFMTKDEYVAQYDFE